MQLERQPNTAKSVMLVVLMLSMSLSAGIVEINRAPWLETKDVAGVGAACGSITRSAGTPIFVDAVNGSDTWDGTWSCPKATLSDALNDSTSNDEIILYSGRYHENVTVDNKDNLLIRAAEGARVVFDGTQSISDDLEVSWGAADSDGIQEVTLPVDGWQLFLAYDEQVPARWPNAQFSDETVFNRSYWAEGTLTNSNNAYTVGWLTDAGPETGVHTGLNETINATGLNPIGAIAVMNLGSFRTNSRVITDWNSANGTFAYDGSNVGWKNKHHAYFLEGKRELIDQDGEWWFNNANNRLHYKTPSGQNANNLDLRVKVQPFAISVENSDGVTIQGLDFFGTTVNFNECDGCSFTNATLEYPSTSKRGLGIAGESEDDRWMTRFYRSTNTFVDRISITNTDGGAIEFQGSAGQSHNNTVNNSYFHAIDWSAADQKGLMVTIYEGGRDMYFTNNTVHLTGASSVLSIGDAPKVFYNEVWDVGHLQTDGAVVQVMQGEAPGAEIAYNWIHDIIKYGARFDAPINEVGEGMNGTMHHNVIWNAVGGLMVKGDYHDINNNTVFNSSSKNDMIILTDNGVNNGNSTIHRNAADTMADHRTGSWSSYPLPSGTYWNNWNGYVNTTDTVWNQLVDPANRDFRPKVNSHLDNMSAGAYDAGASNPWTAGISWTYSTPSAPVAGCMLDYADNYDADATLSDGSCTFSSYTPPSTLDLRLHLDPTNTTSYGGSGTNFADLSGYNNNGTISGATWDESRYRFEMDGCTGSSAPYTCDDIKIPNSQSLRPGPTDEDLAVELNQGSTVQYLTAPNTLAGQTLGGIETSFTISAWVKPTDCGANGGVPTIVSKVFSFKIGCDDGTWHYILGNGTAWYTGNWVDTGVAAENDVWQHVALTRASATTGVEFFLNGVGSYSVSTYEGDLGDNNAERLFVGSRNGTYATADAWHGLIDDLRIYTSDRSSTVADDMNVYPNVTDANLNAFFDFNQGRHSETLANGVGAVNLAAGTGASSADLSSVTGSPSVNRVWDVSTVGSDTVLTFERTVLTASGGWKVPSGVSTADALVVGGGGGGGYNTGGGGGGGGVGFYNSTALTGGSAVTIVVGQGGEGSSASGVAGANGTPSLFGTSIVGGGGGGAGWISGGSDGMDAPTGSPTFAQRGSGGGASNGGTGGTGTTDGGDGSTNAGAGGGGAAADGTSGTTTNAGVAGGDGQTSSITGSSVMYGSGAGGGGWTAAGSGGSGAGDGGRSYSATDGTANRGGGGGGGGNSDYKLGGNGGSGVVIVRYESVREHDWTVEVWFNASSQHTANTQTIFGTFANGGQAADVRYSARLKTNNSVSLNYRTDGSSSVYSITTQPLNDDRWYHLVAVFRDDTNLSLYLDGQFVGDTSVSGSLLVSPNDLFIGSFSNATGGQYGQGFDGQIGSVMMFADALNATNINQLYTSGKGVYSNTTNLSYAQSSSTMLLGQAYSFPLAVANGEVITSYSLSGTLPSGMNFESSNGTIWGTPTVTMTSTTYTVTANNSAGSYSTSFSLTSQHVAPYDLVYSPEDMTLTKGTAMTTNTPSVSGGTITSWEISPSLPSGLALSTSTGAISGTPSVVSSSATYTVTASNTGGSDTATLTIVVNDIAP
ncbi:MAG: putative Ig domain-containing protein, partial [Candidatus Poseidonia sp.]|nr:putative Ig domain-containing protein [Poseidonia sp.]